MVEAPNQISEEPAPRYQSPMARVVLRVLDTISNFRDLFQAPSDQDCIDQEPPKHFGAEQAMRSAQLHRPDQIDPLD